MVKQKQKPKPITELIGSEIYFLRDFSNTENYTIPEGQSGNIKIGIIKGIIRQVIKEEKYTGIGSPPKTQTTILVVDMNGKIHKFDGHDYENDWYTFNKVTGNRDGLKHIKGFYFDYEEASNELYNFIRYNNCKTVNELSETDKKLMEKFLKERKTPSGLIRYE